VVDDDGVSTDYLNGNQLRITCNYTFRGGRFDVDFNAAGGFPGQPYRVDVRLAFPQLPPMKGSLVTSAEASINYDEELVYDRSMLGSVFTLKGILLRELPGVSAHLELDPAYGAGLPNLVGVLGRVRRARYIKDALDRLGVTYGDNRASLTSYVLAGTQMSPEFAADLPKLWDAAMAETKALLDGDKGLKSDSRRARFVAAMAAGGAGADQGPPEAPEEVVALV